MIGIVVLSQTPSAAEAAGVALVIVAVALHQESAAEPPARGLYAPLE